MKGHLTNLILLSTNEEKIYSKLEGRSGSILWRSPRDKMLWLSSIFRELTNWSFWRWRTWIYFGTDYRRPISMCPVHCISNVRFLCSRTWMQFANLDLNPERPISKYESVEQYYRNKSTKCMLWHAISDSPHFYRLFVACVNVIQMKYEQE
jgi:hypothetical protein